jgi:hypothetical protein
MTDITFYNIPFQHHTGFHWNPDKIKDKMRQLIDNDDVRIININLNARPGCSSAVHSGQRSDNIRGFGKPLDTSLDHELYCSYILWYSHLKSEIKDEILNVSLIMDTLGKDEVEIGGCTLYSVSARIYCTGFNLNVIMSALTGTFIHNDIYLFKLKEDRDRFMSFVNGDDDIVLPPPLNDACLDLSPELFNGIESESESESASESEDLPPPYTS